MLEWFLNWQHMVAYKDYQVAQKKAGQIDWDDLRIRKFTKEEVAKNDKYLQMCYQVKEWEVCTLVFLYCDFSNLIKYRH